jgi:malto-oligosyltrehalose trehalohydrolase
VSADTYRWTCPFGAELLDGGRTRFRLWAPGKQEVSVEVEGHPPVAMQRDAAGVFEAIVDCGAGARYRYRVAEDLAVPDPASRLQADDVHGPSVVVDPTSYRWQQPGYPGRPWREAVIYELHAGAMGGFDGIRAQLPRLAALGVTAVELMPIADFAGQRNWGYDGVLSYAPDTAYGTPQQLKAMIDEAHRLNLCVYLDVVYNHFGPDGNYLHAYAPIFFDEGKHSPWGAAIDFKKRQVRDFFLHNALYWLMEYRFDGLRFDAVHAISEQDFLDELGATIRKTTEPGRHVHLVLENERNTARVLAGDFDAQWNDDGHNVLHVLLTGETDSYYSNYAEQPARKLARCLAEGFVYQGEPMSSHGGKPRGEPSGHLPPDAFVLFLQNHDQIGNRALGERLTVLTDRESLRAATVLQLLSPQIPLIFMGEEWGAEEPFLFFTDFHDELAEAVREGRRNEFKDFAAFKDPDARDKIPDPNAVTTFERSIPRLDDAGSSDHAEQLQWYRTLLRIRREQIVSRLAGTTSIGASAVGDKAVVALWRLGDGAILTIAFNVGDTDIDSDCPQGDVLFESRPGAAEKLSSGCLPARSCSVFLSEGGA